MNTRIKKIPVLVVSLLLMLLWGNISVSAEGEWSYFGSETYEWEKGTECPIGIYVESDNPISYIDMRITYDPAILKFNSGAEMEKEGVLTISEGVGENIPFSTMLYFTPITLGKTEIKIDEITITDSTGEESSVSGTQAPIIVSMPEGCALTSLVVNGQKVSDFSSEKTNYSIDVAADIEKAQIEAIAESNDTNINISDTVLEEGNNLVKITTTNTDGNQAVYELNIVREKAVATQTPNLQSPKPVNTPSSISSDSRAKYEFSLNFILLLVAIILILILVILLVFVLLRNRKQKRRYKKTGRTKYSHSHAGDNTVLENSVKGKSRNSQKFTKKRNSNQLQDLNSCEDMNSLEEFRLFDNREVEIEVKHVSISFKREKDESSSLKELIIKTLKRQRQCERFDALKDISFVVKKGDIVGIIGTNGSGKSTLLKIISGVLQPTSGSVMVDKNKIQLLTLGTGFDFELTGRENVYLNGAIIGYTKEFIDQKYDEIVKFAELEGFMDEKVKNYSSGMVSRLGFAIATIRDTPEILILDEVLSVGDMFFREKSNARIKEMMKGGSTVLIVSHSLSVIREDCTKAIWIEKGVLKAIGDPNEVCNLYEHQKNRS